MIVHVPAGIPHEVVDRIYAAGEEVVPPAA
jgi:hypothetical protein